jgi:hypothetical protein
MSSASDPMGFSTGVELSSARTDETINIDRMKKNDTKVFIEFRGK